MWQKFEENFEAAWKAAAPLKLDDFAVNLKASVLAPN